ncbi:uncharacterized protein LOC116614779 [Nematostella vectensis]|uniref:uncharacterized protein LOC116614779 n=1 Tax=Nematostella vectensis TaxID=45351 RepID=UPI0020778C0C|nr:uncharacterized protein LOC116614779 [Nematostella vectensis]
MATTKRMLCVFLTLATTALMVSGDMQCNSFAGRRHYGYALLRHVFQKAHVSRTECIRLCRNTVNCFLANMKSDGKGDKVTCQLNNSTKEQSLSSFLQIPGYEYIEFTNRSCGQKEDTICVKKRALLGDWFQFGSSFFKFFTTPASWSDAHSRCQAIGAELASIANENEDRFVAETFVKPTIRCTANCNVSKELVAKWHLDGTESDVKLINSASYLADKGTNVLFLDGPTNNDFARVPDVDVSTVSFTLAVWLKPKTFTNSAYYCDWGNALKRFQFNFHLDGSLTALLANPVGEAIAHLRTASDKVIKADVWNHVVNTWNRQEKKITIFINGTQVASQTSTLSNVDIAYGGTVTTELGLKRDSGDFKLHGYIKDLMIFYRAMSPDEVQEFYEQDGGLFTNKGAWIGLNDVTTEGTMVWNDGSPFSYSSLTANSHSADCVAMTTESNGTSHWIANPCNIKLPFICKKPQA